MMRNRLVLLTLLAAVAVVACERELEGPLIDSRDDWTPLMIAADEGDLTKVKKLLGKGADVNGRNGDGNTALMYAAYGNHAPIVELLLDHQADVESENFAGVSVFDIATLRKDDLVKSFAD